MSTFGDAVWCLVYCSIYPPPHTLGFGFVLLGDRILRGTIVNRTSGMHKTLHIKPFLLTIFCPINYGPP